MYNVFKLINKPTFKMIALLILVILSITGTLNDMVNGVCANIDNDTEKYLNETTQKIIISYASARGINALISVIQDSELTLGTPIAGVNIALGEALDPLNDIVERLSTVLMYSTVSLVLQLFLFNFLREISINYLMFFSLILFALGKLIYYLNNNNKLSMKLHYYGKLLLFCAVFIRFIIPSIVFIGIQVEKVTLGKNYNQAISTIEKIDTTNDIKIKNINTKAKITEKINKLKNITDHILDLVVVFLIQTILLPIIALVMLQSGFKLIISKIK